MPSSSRPPLAPLSARHVTRSVRLGALGSLLAITSVCGLVDAVQPAPEASTGHEAAAVYEVRAERVSRDATRGAASKGRRANGVDPRKKAVLTQAPGHGISGRVHIAPTPSDQPAPSASPNAATPTPEDSAPSNLSGNRALGRRMLLQAGFGADQWPALERLWSLESGWNHHAANPSGAYGIPQALPGSKMASAGADWRTNPATQIRWGLSYIRGRYGTPSAALAHHDSYGWY